MLTIDQAIDVINQSFVQSNYPDKPQNLYQPISYTLESGGKRIRPALTLLACDLFGASYTKAIPAASGIEIFHNFTLLHDDIMDKSPIRRGRPTVYKKWNDNVAILSGDTMFAIAHQKFYDLPTDILSKVLPLFTQTAIEVCEGQQYDMDFEEAEHVSMGEYIEMIRLKTAVLLAASLKIGAQIAKADDIDCDLIYSFGEKIGIAFQLQDDLLDTFGDIEKFGKSIGNDIRTNKNTFLKIRAFDKAKPEMFQQLQQSFSLPNMIDKVENVTAIFKDLGVKEDLITEMYDYLNSAILDLNQINAAEEKKKQLRDYARFMIEREY